MNKEQMDEFLQSIGGLKNGFNLESNPITDSDFFEVGLGWFPLIKDLITNLIELGWNKEVCQVKEKFGGLRFYINAATSEAHKRISQSEIESMNICEVTGKPGKLRTDIGWYRTLCDEEYERCLKMKKD
jgi:hypothetical protein